MTIQYQQQLSNGTWVDIDDAQFERLAAKVLEREVWFAPRQNRAPMTTIEEVKAAAAKTPQRWDTDWYTQIRVKPAPPAPKAVEMVKCRCGHTVEATLVMNTSRGTSCPDCYDRMSD
jgi:hypothetical protein